MPDQIRVPSNHEPGEKWKSKYGPGFPDFLFFRGRFVKTPLLKRSSDEIDLRFYQSFSGLQGYDERNFPIFPLYTDGILRYNMNKYAMDALNEFPCAFWRATIKKNRDCALGFICISVGRPRKGRDAGI